MKYAIINVESIQQRINELESACTELFNLVHISEGMIEYKIRANELYDITRRKEMSLIPLIPEIEKAFDEGSIAHCNSQDRNHPTTFEQDKQNYMDNLKLDI